MKVPRFWLEIVGLITAIACSLAVLIALLGAFAAAGVGSPPDAQAVSATSPATAATAHSFQGVVTCSRCGARHSAGLGKTAAECTLICVRGGASFALVDGDKSYVLQGDPVLLRRVVGQRARIAGFAVGNTIRVSSVTAEN